MFTGMHVDDSEITLNVCLSKQFTGGDMYFVGRRCENHANSEVHEQVLYLQCNIYRNLTIYMRIIQNALQVVIKTDLPSTTLRESS